MSQHQRVEMSTVQKFKRGIISVPVMEYQLARTAILFRPELAPERKLLTHERAMAMGADDPTKPDYSKYMPKEKDAIFDSKMRPLKHNLYGNVVVHNNYVALKMALRIQCAYRSKKARKTTNLAAKAQAFYSAKKIALVESETAIRKEYADLEALEGLSRVRWDAKIRMTQVSLRSSGTALDRTQTVEYLMNEAIEAGSAQVELRWKELEKEQKITEDMKNMAVRVLASFGGTASAFADKMKDEDNEGDGDDAQLDGDFFDGKKALQQSAKAKPRADSKGNAQKKGKGRRKSIVKEGVVVDKFGMPILDKRGRPSVILDPSDLPSVWRDEKKDEKEYKQMKRTRRRTLIQGLDLRAMFKSGEDDEEARLKAQMASPVVSTESLYKRFRIIAKSFTEKKVREFLMELPSKRHLLQYVGNFVSEEALAFDLNDHFGILERDTETIAKSLFAMLQSDLEFGIMEGFVNDLLRSEEQIIQGSVSLEIADRVEKSRKIDEKRRHRLKSKLQGRKKRTSESQEDEAKEVQKKLEELDEEALFQSMTAYRSKADTYKAALDGLVAARRDMERVRQVVMDRQMHVEVTPDHRERWSERFAQAMSMPEGTDEESISKYSEIRRVCQDFLHSCEHYARIIIDELYKEDEMKAIKPYLYVDSDRQNIMHSRAGRGGTIAATSEDFTLTPGQAVRRKFRMGNIYFKFCTDDNGMYGGSDEYAAKAAGQGILGSIIYNKCHEEGVVVPLQALVDYKGFRLECVAAVPVTITRRDEYGDIKFQGEELLIGSNDRGHRIRNEDAKLRKKLETIAKQINIAPHGVKGSKDTLQTFVPGAADLRGYRGSDESRYYLLNFKRSLPPESCECAPHLIEADRGMSIFWRKLRPEFLRRCPFPVSPDAFSLFIKDSPDCDEQNEACLNASSKLVGEVIPAFADWLSKVPYNQVVELDLTAQMHRRGVNMRHLGLLRSMFYFQLKGTVNLEFSSSFLTTSEDIMREVDPGAHLVINDKSYHLSKKKSAKHGPTGVTLVETVQALSAHKQVAWSGSVANDSNSREVRQLLLEEMVFRTLKNMMRMYFRKAMKLISVPSDRFFVKLLVTVLNAITGSHDDSIKFWREQVTPNVLIRFGPRSLTETEKINIKALCCGQVRAPALVNNEPVASWKPSVYRIVRRLPAVLGFVISDACMDAFRLSPENFRFSTVDILKVDSRAKHNLSFMDFSEAVLIAIKARKVGLWEGKGMKVAVLGRAVLLSTPLLTLCVISSHNVTRPSVRATKAR